MGGFRQLTVRRKTIVKRHNIMGYRKWLIDAGVVAAKSDDATVEYRHYYRNMRINKKLLCALIQHKAETLRSKYYEITFELKNLFEVLTQDPYLEKIDVIIKKMKDSMFHFPRLCIALSEQKLNDHIFY